MESKEIGCWFDVCVCVSEWVIESSECKSVSTWEILKAHRIRHTFFSSNDTIIYIYLVNNVIIYIYLFIFVNELHTCVVGVHFVCFGLASGNLWLFTLYKYKIMTRWKRATTTTTRNKTEIDVRLIRYRCSNYFKICSFHACPFPFSIFVSKWSWLLAAAAACAWPAKNVQKK